MVKFNDKRSPLMHINLGFAQGSVHGPLFFLIFINDLAFSVDFYTKMFTDDTTLLDSNNDLNPLIERFLKKLEPL